MVIVLLKSATKLWKSFFDVLEGYLKIQVAESEKIKAQLILIIPSPRRASKVHTGY
jgi:hypothetical protein